MASRSIAARLTLTVVCDDDTSVTVTTNMQDQLRWEMNHDGEAWLAGDAPSFTKLLETAFYAGRRTGQVEEKHFDRWKTHVIDLEKHEDEDEDEEEDEPEDEDPATFQ